MLWTLSSQTTGISFFLSHLPFPAAVGHSELRDIIMFQNKKQHHCGPTETYLLTLSHLLTFQLSLTPSSMASPSPTLKFILLQSPHTPVANANGSYSVLMLLLHSIGACGNHTLFLELSTSWLSFSQRHLVFDRGFSSCPSASPKSPFPFLILYLTSRLSFLSSSSTVSLGDLIHSRGFKTIYMLMMSRFISSAQSFLLKPIG